jgi:cytochrome c oxidase subunit II
MRHILSQTRHRTRLMSALAALVTAAAGCSQVPALDVAAPGTGATGLGGGSSTIEASGSTGSATYGNPTPGSYFFSPTPDTVVAGSTVTFQFDDVMHTVTWVQNPGNVADIPATSDADSTRVLPAGTYTYHCSIHTYMTGTIVAQ